MTLRLYTLRAARGMAGLVRIAPAKQLLIRLHVALRSNPYGHPNLIKEKLPHGGFGKWLEDNISGMTYRQCNKYMSIAKSNTHSSGYLDINSEVLLLAFEPEAREVIREDLKDCKP